MDRILPKEVHGKVRFSENNIYISAHLLNTYSPDDKDPAVKGAYSTHTLLYSYVKQRIAEIYRTVFISASTLKIDEVIVECMHGVRYITMGATREKLGSEDRATVLYKTVLRGKASKTFDWTKIGNEMIEEAWIVNTDIIPSLAIKPFV